VERGKGRFEWASAAIGEPTPFGGYFAQHFAEVVGRRPQRIRQKIHSSAPHSHSWVDMRRVSTENASASRTMQ
jgi:hypothetical protein